MPFLESGCALVIGCLGADGAPFATRGWGLDVLDAGAGRVRVLLLAEELPAVGSLVAVTGTSVRTLRSLQLKGPVVAVEPSLDAAGAARVDRYTDAFLGDIEDTDGTPRPVLDRLRPVGPLGAVHLDVTELYDQTPGPTAGAAVG